MIDIKELREWLYAEEAKAYDQYVKAESPSWDEAEHYGRSLAFEEVLKKLGAE